MENQKECVSFQDIIFNQIKEGNFIGIIDLLSEHYTQRQLAKKINCSRRAIGRYRNRERKIPISLIKTIVHAFSFDEELLFQTMSDDESTFCKEIKPATIGESIIWNGGEHELINSLYVIQHCIQPMSFFQMSYITEIEPDRLADYACGKRTISSIDVSRILESLNLKTSELFPQLISYDFDKTFLPLQMNGLDLDHIKTKSHRNWYDYYITEDEDDIILFQPWPINRYDGLGKIIYNIMPNELTIDEFYNTDILYFYNFIDNSFYNGPAFCYQTLPPNYYRYQCLIIDGGKPTDDECGFYDMNIINYKSLSVVKKIEIVGIDEIKIYFTNNKFVEVNIRPYTESNSVLYKALKDPEYLSQATLCQLDPNQVNTQIIRWPHGQFIRIDEVQMDMDPFHTCYTFNYLSEFVNISNWMIWK